MTGGQIHVRLVTGITPNVVADGGLHIPARGVKIFPIALHLVDESGFGNRDTDVVLLASLFRGRRRRVGGECAYVADRTLPKVTMRRASAFAQFSQVFVGNINPWMNAEQLMP